LAAMASYSTKNAHQAKPPPARNAFLNMPMGEVVKKRWEHSLGAHLMVDAKKRFTVTAGSKQYVLADIRLVRADVSSDPDRSSLPMEFFFDGPSQLSDVNFELFNKAFEAKVEEQLQERRLQIFRRNLATRQRKGRKVVGEDAEGGDFEGADADDESWKAYLSQRVDKTNLEIQGCREAGCMLTFIAIRATLSVSACQTLGEVAFPEYFATPEEAAEAAAEEDKEPLPRWVWFMVLLFIIMFCAASVAVMQLFQGPAPRLGKP